MEGCQGHPSVSLSWEREKRCSLRNMPTVSPLCPRDCWSQHKHSEFCSLLCPGA